MDKHVIYILDGTHLFIYYVVYKYFITTHVDDHIMDFRFSIFFSGIIYMLLNGNLIS